MLYVFSLMMGAMISLMVAVNGALTAAAGRAFALVLIHVVGLVAISLVLLLRRERPTVKGLSPLLLSAGLVGVLTITFNNLSFGRISVSAMMALGLLGESIFSLLSDHYGVLGLPRRSLQKGKLLGLPLMLLGITIMLDSFDLLAVVASFMSGFSVLLSRLMNGKLTRQSTVYNATFFNYVTGLLGACLLFLLEGSHLVPLPGPLSNYLGGLLGVVIVLGTSALVGRIASFYLTLSLFIGQVGAGVLLDYLFSGTFSWVRLLGGIFVLLGLVVSLWMERRRNEKQGDTTLLPEADPPLLP